MTYERPCKAGCSATVTFRRAKHSGPGMAPLVMVATCEQCGVEQRFLPANAAGHELHWIEQPRS